MGKRERRAYREAIRDRYQQASKADKQLILDEFCRVCQYHRKHAIRLLRKRPPTKPLKAKPGRKTRYNTPELLTVLSRIWLTSDQMCSKRLKAALPLWLPHYATYYHPIAEPIARKLLQISPATIDRLLKAHRVHYPRGLCGTKPGKLLRNQIPIRTHHWDITKPGFMEADTLAHCGTSLEGEFVWSLTLTDILTGWTASRAVWNKGAFGIIEQINDIEAHLPFRLRGFDCDNGGEFINHHLVRHFAARKNQVFLTRSRPNHRNDNPHVEQKNWDHVRHLFGYDRFDNPELVPLMNDLYRNEWALYQNHFCPTLKLLSKERVNSKYKKHYENQPATPYQRVLLSAYVSPDAKMMLKARQAILNPFALRAMIQSKLKAIFKLVTVTTNLRHRI